MELSFDILPGNLDTRDDRKLINEERLPTV